MDEINKKSDTMELTAHDKVQEYFELKGVLRTLRGDLKDIKDNHEEAEQIEVLSKELKELKEKLKNDEDVRIIEEKISTTKERMELIKEIIKVELIETNQEEVKRDGRKLKIVSVLKEMKDEQS